MEAAMRTITVLVWLLALGLSQMTAAESGSAGNQKKQEGESKGLTVEELRRGLKSAAQDVEKEISKIGPAIRDTVKTITKGDSEKQKPEAESKEQK
jgi:hypothetical protein